MHDMLWIIARWGETQQQNCFSIRGIGERYDALYQWLNGGKTSARSVYTDFPWDTIVFDDPFDEQQFLVLYEGTIEFDKETPYLPLPVVAYRKGVVPIEEREVGKSYLGNCGHYHIHQPVKGSIVDDLEEKMAKILRKEIDREILDELRKLAKLQ